MCNTLNGYILTTLLPTNPLHTFCLINFVQIDIRLGCLLTDTPPSSERFEPIFLMRMDFLLTRVTSHTWQSCPTHTTCARNNWFSLVQVSASKALCQHGLAGDIFGGVHCTKLPLYQPRPRATW